MTGASAGSKAGSPKLWSGQVGFIMAALGYAIGLGNIWRFSYVAGTNGGGSFVLLYLLFVGFIALPILLCDFVVGRRGGGSPPLSMTVVARLSGVSRHWALVGWLGLLAALLVLSYYSVIAGWTLVYSVQGLTGNVAHTAPEALLAWEDLLASPSRLVFWHTLFIVAVAAVSTLGLRGGVERFVKTAMPMFLITLLGLVVYAAIFGDFAAGVAFLFAPRWEQISTGFAVAALGQALWSLGVGASVLMVYGAYLPADVNLGKSAIIIAFGDATAAILGGLAVFPLVLASGLDPASGPGLIFQTLPVALSSAPGGLAVATAFFIVLMLAGFTSAIGILELIVAWMEERSNTSRSKIVGLTAGCAWLFGFVTVLSFNKWSGFHPLGFFEIFRTSTIYDIMDFTVANIFMPLAGIVVCIFVGWRMDESIALSELGVKATTAWYRAWRFLIRWVIPLALLALMVSLLGS